MKDKLRELAEFWKNSWSRTQYECAEELLAILDAEDGVCSHAHQKWNIQGTHGHCVNCREEFSGAHPARSGVVSEEGVIAAARELCKRNAEACGVDHRDNWNLYAEDFTADARAALESFMENRK